MGLPRIVLTMHGSAYCAAKLTLEQCANNVQLIFINILCTQNTVLAGNFGIQCLISSFVPVHFSCHAKGYPKFHNLNEKPVSCSTMSSLFCPCMVMHILQQNKLWISVPITITLYLFRYCVFNTLQWQVILHEKTRIGQCQSVYNQFTCASPLVMSLNTS